MFFRLVKGGKNICRWSCNFRTLVYSNGGFVSNPSFTKAVFLILLTCNTYDYTCMNMHKQNSSKANLSFITEYIILHIYLGLAERNTNFKIGKKNEIVD